VVQLAEDEFEIYRLKAELCKAFSDPKRLMLVNLLRQGETTVNELTNRAVLPQAVVSRNLAVLRHYGVVQARRDGNRIYYSLTDNKIIEACDLVHDILLGRLKSQNELAGKLALK
jgi:ArsR family transcriptional regulator